MSDVLLTLNLPANVVEVVEDLLLARADLLHGFTTNRADGHGKGIQLAEPREMVSGHAARFLVSAIGGIETIRAILTDIKAALPRSSISYWLVPVIEFGRL